MLVEGLVSTIIPVYNRPALLREAVIAFWRKPIAPLKSSSSTMVRRTLRRRWLRRCSRCIRHEIRWFDNANGGPGAAREAGRQMARGEFIQYLDSDDLLLPRQVRTTGLGLRQHLKLAISYGQTRLYEIDEHASESRGSGPGK